MSHVQDPKTQAELLEYAKQGCTIFQASPGSGVPSLAHHAGSALLVVEWAASITHVRTFPVLNTAPPQLSALNCCAAPPSIMQDFKDQCEAYVTLYGPLVFNMLISYLQPDFLCARLGYCPVGPPPLVVS